MTPPNERPKIVITRVDTAPDDLAAQLPVHAELVRILPGSDRPDYALAIAKKPIHFRTTLTALEQAGVDPSAADPQMIRVHDDGTADLVVFGLVLCARVAGETIHLAMEDFPVNIAYIIDNTQLGDASVDFAKSYFAAIGFVSMEASGSPVSPA
ncbi:hypothetical protein [Agromyces cerinus]|uniref:Uncharacterized protein n=1 Tax=Agromyces cerinus subsp. cerinus TaxID=232089 RepID=A0A1N6G267_9MICO|nr:hypothetical protein [Agromyces cerinus]SIO01603.1 hypothetical protein SAMN05443544_2230 [Agromyces cerinus subsp. cerinus]